MNTAIGKIKLPYPTPSGNEIKRMHPQVYKSLRDEMTILLRLGGKPIPRCEPGEYRVVEIERRGGPALDYDNLVSGAKPLVDAIRIVGLIEDDKPACVDLRYRQMQNLPKSDRATLIWISRSEAFKCEAGHTVPSFGCQFCIIKARGLESWLCWCGDERLPEWTRCNMCGCTRPERFNSEQAVIEEAAVIRAAGGVR